MLIDRVKVALRTLTDDEGINQQIQYLIDACVLDLESANLEVLKDDGEPVDKNIELAIVQYVKGYFFSNEEYIRRYDMVKAHLGIVYHD